MAWPAALKDAARQDGRGRVHKTKGQVSMQPIENSGVQPGHVWEGWFAHVDEEHFADYEAFLGNVYRATLDAWMEAGLIVGYKILSSMSRQPDDWNLGILLEHETMAEMDVPDAVWEEISNKAKDGLSIPGVDVDELKANAKGWRRVIGSRMFREIAWA